MPKNLKQDKDLKRGLSQMLPANDIPCVKRMGNRYFVMSIFLNSTESLIVCRRKCAEKFQIPCPEIIIAYNKLIDKVDLMDQKKITYF
jgi:hypothetical protein